MAKEAQKPRLGKRKDLAAELRITRQRVEALIKQGRLNEGADGWIDLDLARTEYKATLDPARRLQYEETLEAKSKPKAPPATRRKPYKTKRGAHHLRLADGKAGEPGQGEFQLISISDAKTAKAIADAKTAELKYAQLIATMVPRDEVVAKEFNVARMVRDRVLAFPTRLQNVVPPECMKALVSECERLVRELQEEAAKIGETSPQP